MEIIESEKVRKSFIDYYKETVLPRYTDWYKYYLELIDFARKRNISIHEGERVLIENLGSRNARRYAKAEKRIYIYSGHFNEKVFKNEELIYILKKKIESKVDFCLFLGKRIHKNGNMKLFEYLVKMQSDSCRISIGEYPIHASIVDDSVYFEKPHQEYDFIRSGYEVNNERDFSDFFVSRMMSVKSSTDLGQIEYTDPETSIYKLQSGDDIIDLRAILKSTERPPLH
jgi:hypothetical protein